MRKAIGTMILAMLIVGMLSPLTIALPEADEQLVVPTILEVYTFPRYPIGGEWDSAGGTNGDIITVYAVIENGDYADLKTGFCNRAQCSMGDAWASMANVGGNLWSFQLPGDDLLGWSVYEASSVGGPYGSYVYFQIYAEDTATWDYAYYPDENGNGILDEEDKFYFYPAFPPSQINATSALSKSTMFTSETFTVSGKANYWNSTSYPNDFSKLLPADECPVTVKVGLNTFNTKTDIWGNYSVQVTAPAVPGSYSVNVTVSNATANRNVTCVSTDKPITVNAHSLAMTLESEPTAALVNETVWANGTVELDGAPAGAGLQVNLTVEGTGITWTATTVADGTYSSQFTVPADVGDYTVNATVWHPYNIRAWSEVPFSVLATPLADLAVSSANIVRTGILLEGNNQRFNITVRNSGIANATDARINISMDGTLFNSSVRTINKNANVSISINWTATPGIHNLTVFADPQNLIEESNEANNLAWSLFTVVTRTIGITLDLSAANVEPSTPIWANGTVTIDGAAAPAGTEVNVSIEGTDQYWLVDTDATGNYSAQFTSSIEGTYTINATVHYQGFAIHAWAEESLTVAIPPTPDLAVLNSDITIIGNLTSGTILYFNIIVRNIGTDDANSVQVNVSLNGELLSSSRQNIAAGAQRTINVTWNAVNGTYNLSVDVDPEDKFIELSESNNHAWKAFTVAPTPPPEDEEPEPEDEGNGNMLVIAAVAIAVIAIIGLLLFKFVPIKPKP